MKLKIRIDDDETRALWETAKRAKAEVESWPAWKHNEVPRASSDAAPSVAGRAGSRLHAATVPAKAGFVGVSILQARTDDPRGKMDNASRHDEDVCTTSAEHQHRSAG